MNKEIKEMLDKWNKVCNNKLEYVGLTKEQMQLFYDYITNLQEENKKLKERIHALEEHNKHLNKEAQKYYDMLMECEYGNRTNE